LAIQALAQSATVSDLAARHGVSRKFVYQQTHKARSALDDAFSPATPGNEVLFELAVTKAWLRQAIVGLTLICRSSYRGIVEFLRDLLGLPVSAASPGTRDASVRCVSRCRTSATPCSLSPACSCGKPACCTACPPPRPHTGLGGTGYARRPGASSMPCSRP